MCLTDGPLAVVWMLNLGNSRLVTAKAATHPPHTVTSCREPTVDWLLLVT